MRLVSGIQRKHTRRSCLKLTCAGLFAWSLRAEESTVAAQVPDMTRNIPSRAPQALTGSQFAESTSSVERQQREHAILGQILEGNMPGFLRQLAPVKLSCAVASGKTVNATIFVMPEYLSIGSDSDFLRIPMDLHTATAIADRFGFTLPTRKIVDAIYHQSTSRFTPQPLPAGPRMTSTEYYRHHNGMIEDQSRSRAFHSGALVAGHKKDVVLTNRLNSNPGRIAIYGWHRETGVPIQPLSTVHGADYADYSHGIRLVAPMAMIEGRLRSVHDILRDAVFAKVLSDEGPIHVSTAPATA